MAKVGYARTSTIEQEAGLEAQLRDLKASGCDKIFQEHASGVKQRDELEKALNYVREGDEFVICKIDRLSRSVLDFMKITESLKEKGVKLRVLNLGLDMDTEIGQLVVTILASFAQMERNMMLERQKEGIAKARESGKYIGRKPLPEEIRTSVKTLLATGASKVWIANHLKIGQASVFRIAKELREGRKEKALD